MKTLTFAAAYLSLCFTTAVFSAEAGKAVGVNPDASARQGSADRTLVVGADVSVGEQVITGPSGRVQLLFSDNTRIVVGPGSALRIESYLLNGSRADKFAVNALAGTFRFISGNSAKPAYSITTPTASIAVRGTEFDIAVTRGQTQVMLYEGAVQLCRGSTCVDLTKRCDLGTAGNTGAAVLDWRKDDRSGLTASFPFANIQSILLPQFRVSGAQACLTPPAAPSNSSLIDSSSSSGTTTPPTTPTFPPTTPTIPTTPPSPGN